MPTSHKLFETLEKKSVGVSFVELLSSGLGETCTSSSRHSEAQQILFANDPRHSKKHKEAMTGNAAEMV